MKLAAIEKVLVCLNDSPFKPEFNGVFMSRRTMAEAILNQIDQYDYMVSAAS